MVVAKAELGMASTLHTQMGVVISANLAIYSSNTTDLWDS